MNGANIATMTKTKMMTSPSTAPRRLTSRRQARAPGLSSASSRSKVPETATLAPQPRVDENVGNVGEQVEQDVGAGGHQRDALNHGIVTIEDTIDDQLAEPRN